MGVLKDEQGAGKPKIVVVDDSVGIQCVTKALLEKAGCEVETASDGFEALSRIVEFQPQLVFIDVMIPRVNGYQLCAVIKQNPAFINVPVILLGAKDSHYDRVRGRMVGASQYLLKPFARDELLDVIKRYLDTESQDIISAKIAS